MADSRSDGGLTAADQVFVDAMDDPGELLAAAFDAHREAGQHLDGAYVVPGPGEQVDPAAEVAAMRQGAAAMRRGAALLGKLAGMTDAGSSPLRAVPDPAVPDAQDPGAEMAELRSRLEKIRNRQAEMNSGGLGGAMREAFSGPPPQRRPPR